MTALALGYGLSFDDLHDREGLARLDAAFVSWLKDANIDAHARLMAPAELRILNGEYRLN